MFARTAPTTIGLRAALRRTPQQVRTIYTTKPHVAHTVSLPAWRRSSELSGLGPRASWTPPLLDAALSAQCSVLSAQCSVFSADLLPPPTQNFPFSYANKKSFAAKYVGTVGTCFLVPFVAVGYQLYVPLSLSPSFSLSLLLPSPLSIPLPSFPDPLRCPPSSCHPLLRVSPFVSCFICSLPHPLSVSRERDSRHLCWC